MFINMINCTCTFIDSLISFNTHVHSWYFGDISRAESEKLLLASGIPSGTFLVRTSSSQKDSLSLSLRDGDGVKHYRIRRSYNREFYIARQIPFLTLKVSLNLVCHVSCG